MPVGLLFVMMGALLAGYGLVVSAKAPTHLGYNLNAIWGAVMIAFGALMWLGARTGRNRRG
ncbi:MAG TPA: hypothetical protein VHA11_02110 [Bryobacteraceae bacterium]|nr:hypothetical protein [Bryobacteraceae bacterium]